MLFPLPFFLQKKNKKQKNAKFTLKSVSQQFTLFSEHSLLIKTPFHTFKKTKTKTFGIIFGVSFSLRHKRDEYVWDFIWHICFAKG